MITKIDTIEELSTKFPDYGCHIEDNQVRKWKHLLEPLIPYIRGKRMYILFETMYFLTQRMYPRPYFFVLMPPVPETAVKDILSKCLKETYANWNYLTKFALTSAPVKTVDEARIIEMPPEEGLAVFYDMNLTRLMDFLARDITIKGMENGRYSGMYPEILYDPETGNLTKTGENYKPIFNEVMGQIIQIVEPYSSLYQKPVRDPEEKNKKKKNTVTQEKPDPDKESPAAEIWKILSTLKPGTRVSYGWRGTGTVLSVSESREYVRIQFDRNNEKIYIRNKQIKDIEIVY